MRNAKHTSRHEPFLALIAAATLISCARAATLSTTAGSVPEVASATDADCGRQADDAPAVLLFEHKPWLVAVGSDFPTLAIWLDGSVVFLHEDGGKIEAKQTSIASVEAHRLANSIATSLRGVPELSSVSESTDQRTVRIAVRDGSGWQAAAVYGLTRDGPPIPMAPLPCPPGSRRRWCGSVERPEQTPTEPAGFFAAYRALLGALPTTGRPFQPTDIKALFVGFDHARGTPVPWPAELPPPPHHFVPSKLGPGAPRARAFVIPAKYERALDKLQQAVYSTDPPRGILFNQHQWSMALIRRYRGQEAVERMLRCVRDRSPAGAR